MEKTSDTVIRNLSSRQYTPGCPVVVSQGKLVRKADLEETHVLLEVIGLSERTIAELQIRICCRDPQGEEVAAAEYCCTGLQLQRGERYSCPEIPLPAGMFSRFSVVVTHAVFADGEIWDCPEDAVWGVLPAFRKLGQSLPVKALHLSREALPDGVYAYREPADLWYCTCGGVNHREETACYRCRREKAQVSAYASPDWLDRHLAEQQRKRERAAEEADRVRREKLAAQKQAAAEKAAAVKADAQAKIEEKKAEAQRRAEEKKAVQTAQTAQEPQEAPASPSRKSSGRGKLALLAILALILTVGVWMLVSRDFGKSTAETPAEPEIVEPADLPEEEPTDVPTMTPAPKPTPQPTTGPEATTNGDYTAVYVHADKNNRYLVNPDVACTYFPEATTCSFFATEDLGDSILPYLKMSYSFAYLIDNGTASGISGNGEAFSTDDLDSGRKYCLLVFRFDGGPKLIGYYVGTPEKYDERTCLLPVIQCDYDMTELCEQETERFLEGKESLLANYIPLEEIPDSGAVAFLAGYCGQTDGYWTEDDTMLYHVWQQLTSGCATYMEDLYALDRTISSFQGKYYQYYLLLDDKFEIVGYSTAH